MQGKDIIKAIMAEGSIGTTELARRLGYKSAANVNNLLNRQQADAKDMRVETLVEFAKALGYEIVIRKAGKKVKDGEYVIGGE